MALGRPVVATGWSGNVDFMSGPGCFAVPYALVPARDPQGIYDFPQARWAEPDPRAAADALRRIDVDPAMRALAPRCFEHPDYRLALAPRGLASGRDGV